MYRNKKVLAIITAAGKGKRLQGKGVGDETYKQYMELRNKPVLAYTVETFQNSKFVDEIYIVTNEDKIEYCQKEVVDKYELDKVTKIIPGGETRQESMQKALDHVDDEKLSYIITHDGARPFLKSQTLEKLIKGMEKHMATILAVPSIDTIKVVSDTGKILGTPDRATLWQTQTPQMFLSGILIASYENAKEFNIKATDDSSLVEMMGFPVNVIEGDYNNIKITIPTDLTIGEVLLELKADEPKGKKK